MIDPNNRISPTGIGYGKPQGKQPIPGQGGDEFERLLRQKYVQQQSRKAQKSVEPALTAEASASEAIHFSKHALQRLEKRQIELAPEQNRRLENAVHAAADKGARQSLVMMDGIAFVVNVQARTVVTALDVASNAGQERNPVFTNIDSAVLA